MDVDVINSLDHVAIVAEIKSEVEVRPLNRRNDSLYLRQRSPVRGKLRRRNLSHGPVFGRNRWKRIEGISSD